MSNTIDDLIFEFIKYNKWRFIVLIVGLAVIIGVSIWALIYDPIPWWGVLFEAVIMAASVGSVIYYYVRYRKWLKKNEDSEE